MNKLPFSLTFSAMQEVFDKFWIYETLEATLNKSLIINNYTEKIERIVFTYMGYKLDDPIHNKELRYYNKRKKRLELSLKLDYEKVLQANETEMLQMMAQLYLEAIKTYPNIRGKVKLSEFDYIRFYEDVEALFVEKGWVEKQHAVQTIN